MRLMLASAGIAVLGIGGVIIASQLRSEPETTFTISTPPIEMLHAHVHTLSGHHALEVTSEVMRVPEDVWATDITIRVKNAPASTLHHVQLFQTDAEDSVCTEWPKPLYVTSSESSAIQDGLHFPRPYALLIKKGTPIRLAAMLHNPLPPDGPGGMYEDVSVELSLSLASDVEPETLVPVEYSRLVLTDIPCNDGKITEPPGIIPGTFTVPPESGTFTKRDDSLSNGTGHITFEEAGILVTERAHFHPWSGGKEMSVYLNGKLLSTYHATLRGDEPWSWVIPVQHQLRRIEKGDALSIDTVYENLAAEPDQGAMGMFGLYFARDRDRL